MSGLPALRFPSFLWSECRSEATRPELPTNFTDLVEATTGNVWPSPWTRSAFCPVEMAWLTAMIQKRSNAVIETFYRLHEDGIIYRANRLVNCA